MFAKPIVSLFIVSILTHFSLLAFPAWSHAQVVQASRVDIANFGGSALRYGNAAVSGVYDYQWFLGEDSLDLDVLFGSGDIVAFSLENTTQSNTLRLTGNGVGIGAVNPQAELHILADDVNSPFNSAQMRCEVTNAFAAQDRNLLQLINNGPVIMDFIDTSVAPVAQYQIRTAANRFSMQQFGGNRAGLVIFSDGAVRFVARQLPNVTVTSEGTLSIVGSAPGGGNLNVGVGSEIGPNDGNLFVKRNIIYNGELQGPSDRNMKENIEEINARDILAKVVDLPVSKWNYKSDNKRTPHIGPMAQDFHAAFGVGQSDKRISMLDSNGVALAAIKGLHELVDQKDKQLEELQNENAKQSKLIEKLSQRLERIESRVDSASK
jgi:hypothetical protein